MKKCRPEPSACNCHTAIAVTDGPLCTIVHVPFIRQRQDISAMRSRSGSAHAKSRSPYPSNLCACDLQRPLTALSLAKHLAMQRAIPTDQLNHTTSPKPAGLVQRQAAAPHRNTDAMSHPSAALHPPHGHLFFFAGPFAISSGEAPSSAIAARLPFGGFLPCSEQTCNRISQRAQNCSIMYKLSAIRRVYTGMNNGE